MQEKAIYILMHPLPIEISATRNTVCVDNITSYGSDAAIYVSSE
jgi:hypothetical protein